MRPEQALAPLPWQQGVWQQLAGRSSQQRLAHALLLHGTAGIGKGHLARLFAWSLLCEAPLQQLPCGQCHACMMLAADSHPDLFLATPAYGVQDDDGDTETKPRKGKKAISPGKQIRIDCIRELIHFSAHSAHQGGRRIAIVEPAEWLNHNAANALLKTLEEPGEGQVILLVSHEPSRLLPTLRSRCQALACPTPARELAIAWLKQHTSPERAETALAISMGAPLKALDAVLEDRDLLFREVMLTLEACRNREVTYLFAAESLAGHDALMIMEWWLALVHRQACAAPMPSLMGFHDRLLDARRKLQSTANPNARFLFESLLVDWMQLGQ